MDMQVFFQQKFVRIVIQLVVKLHFSLSKQSGDESTGAVYSADFQTAFGGALTITVSGTDGFDSAEDNRTASFSVDKDKPWLVSDSVSPLSAGEEDDITFDVVYCVFEAQTGASVSVDVGGVSHDLNENGDADDGVCVNGVGKNYTVSTTVAWNADAQQFNFQQVMMKIQLKILILLQ